MLGGLKSNGTLKNGKFILGERRGGGVKIPEKLD
jgi:hypothetical protein